MIRVFRRFATLLINNLYRNYDMNFIKDFILYNVQDYIYNIRTLSENIKGETIHRMYRNHDYFGDGSVNDMWRPLTIQTI